MNDISEDFKLKSFVSKNSLPSKNQKAHVLYLKRKRNKINNHTAQGEMPEFNSISISESVTSKLSKNYSPKGKKYITGFKDIPLTEMTVNEYKKNCKSLSHVRTGNNIDGCIIVDKTSVVGFIAVETKNNGQKWLQALEVTNLYRGYGLSPQLLKLAISHYGATHLSVNKNNEIAIRLYEKNGFKEYTTSNDMIFMKRINLIRGGGSIEEVALLEAVSKGAKPIFIINSFTKTRFGAVITTVTHSEYSHSSLSFTSKLDPMYSYAIKGSTNRFGGFAKESISGFIDRYELARIDVKCMFVKKSDFDKIKYVTEYLEKNQKNTSYAFGNLVNVLFGRGKENSPISLNSICSQFVSNCLKYIDVDITGGKFTNIVTPKDLYTTTDPKVYTIFTGLAKDYKKSKIDKQLRDLRNRAELIKEMGIDNNGFI